MTDAVGRLVVVLGYSDGGQGELHPICAQRLVHAERITTETDVVVLSGWARVPGTQPEAELMAEAWGGPACDLVIDPDARTTVGNATNAIDDVYRTKAQEVVVVTSRWHAPRARAAFRWQLRRTGATVITASPSHPGRVRDWLLEVLRWGFLPLQLVTSGQGPDSSNRRLPRLRRFRSPGPSAPDFESDQRDR